MSHNTGSPEAMLRTVRVLLTAAIARKDARWMSDYVERCYELCLVAAAGQEVPALPGASWHDRRHLLKIDTRSDSGELRLTLQADGYAALVRTADRQATLRSQDGTIRQHLRFDREGHAVVVLEDTAQVRRALAHLHVVVEEPGPTTPEGAGTSADATSCRAPARP